MNGPDLINVSKVYNVSFGDLLKRCNQNDDEFLLRSSRRPSISDLQVFAQY